MITIKEIADLLGLSSTTVSNVINGKYDQVSDATIERVKKLLKEYNYVSNMTARNLATNNSKIIGVAMQSRSDKYENFIKDPYNSEIIGAIEKSIRQSGYFMMIYVADSISEIVHYISTWNVDGLILLGMNQNDIITIRQGYKKPMVSIDSYNTETSDDRVYTSEDYDYYNLNSLKFYTIQ